MALQWWLGLPLLTGDPSDTVLCPGCSAQVDQFGDHLLCCPRNNYSRRHLAVQDALTSILVEAAQPHHREVAIPNCPDGQLRPADLLLSGWHSGADAAVDLTVSHGWQASERSDRPTRERWRTFLTRRERAKKDKYLAPCRAAGWAFLPMAFGTWGGLGPEAAKLLARLLKRAAGWAEGDLRSRRQEELRQTLGVALMKHVWALLDSKNFLS